MSISLPWHLDGDNAPHTLLQSSQMTQIVHKLTERMIEMARPTKPERQLKKHFITIRFDDTQYSILCMNATRAGISKTDYIRRQATTGKVSVYYNLGSDISQVQEITRELSAIGSNLNQIARYFNSGGMQTQAIRQDINECITAILSMRDAVVEMVGGQNGNNKAHRK